MRGKKWNQTVEKLLVKYAAANRLELNCKHQQVMEMM